jgi:hypothetical protein
MRLPEVCRGILSLLVAFAVFCSQQAFPAPQNSTELKIVVLEGEDGVNIIKKKTAVKPIVEVRDKNDLPIAGVAVVIGLGAAGVFDSGQKQVTLATDANGRATVPNFRPTTKGPVEIHVQASYQGQTASLTIHQTNFMTASQALKAGKTPGSSTSSTASSSASSASSTVASASSAVASSSGGLSGLAIAGIVGGVAAAGAGAAYASGILGNKSSNSGPNCSSQLTSLESAINALQPACVNGTNLTQCQAAGQNVLNSVGQLCSCFGGGNLPSQDLTFFQQVIQALQQEGFNTSQYSACGQ